MSTETSNSAKLVTILDYCSFLCLIGLFVEKDDDAVKFHTNQGLLLAITELLGGVIFTVLQFLPYIGNVFSVLGSIFSVACLVLSLLGIYHAIREEKKPLPLMGTLFNIIK
ncbi:MAG: DUF4870 domain-containing protein [Clostridia bacterium]|nr:DUF4870 domain-containing protein [Clostridia bacterium]